LVFSTNLVDEIDKFSLLTIYSFVDIERTF
jgi:hypothetical protein